MMKALALAMTVLFVLAGPARAQGDKLAKCMADNTTGKERKELARWIFTAMAAHPDIKDLANVTPEAFAGANRAVATLLTRLFTETCAAEVRAVVANRESSQAFRSAFENLGRLAMAEIMTNPDVASAISKFEDYLDKPKLEAVLRSK